MQQPRIPYAQSQALGNLRCSTRNPGARNVTNQKPDSFFAAAFLFFFFAVVWLHLFYGGTWR